MYFHIYVYIYTYVLICSGRGFWQLKWGNGSRVTLCIHVYMCFSYVCVYIYINTCMQWPGFLAVYMGLWLACNFLRPIRIAAAAAISPLFDRSIYLCTCISIYI